MTMMERLRLAKRVCEWYFTFDPYNGCPEEDALRGTVLALNTNPQEIVDMISDGMKELDDPDRYSWLIREGNALLQILA